MKRVLKTIPFGGPLVLLAWLVLSWVFEYRRTDVLLMAVGVAWPLPGGEAEDPAPPPPAGA